jgi:DNA-binding CsgD family transcriptional regulator
MRRIRVGVADEHEVFCRGLVACLRDDPMIEVVDPITGKTDDGLDVAVVSPKFLASDRFGCPVVVCSPDPGVARPAAPGNLVLAVLPRATLTPEQLIGAVRAAAAGLRVDNAPHDEEAPGRLDQRRLAVLRLLARGADTQEISVSLRYSERTIKSLIHEIEQELGARNRVQAVAQGIRLGLI